MPLAVLLCLLRAGRHEGALVEMAMRRDGKGSVLEVMSTPRGSAEVVMSLGMILGDMAGPCSEHRLALRGRVGSGLCAVMLVRMLVRMP